VSSVGVVKAESPFRKGWPTLAVHRRVLLLPPRIILDIDYVGVGLRRRLAVTAEPYPVRGQTINTRRPDSGILRVIATQVVIAHVVDKDEEDIGERLLRGDMWDLERTT